MKNPLLFCLLFAGGTTALAQPLQTLYYKSGQKYLQGHWTFTKSDLVPGAFGVGPHPEQPRQPRRIPYLPEPDGFVGRVFRIPVNYWSHIHDPAAALRIVPEGLLTYWPNEGTEYVEITYKAGVPNGPFANYYAPGEPLQKGNLLQGMPHGSWTYYYKEGKPFFTGTFKAYSQLQLEELWTGNYKGITQGPPTARTASYKEEEALSAVSYNLGAFLYFLAALPKGSQRDGPFVFRQKDGTVWAELLFKDDLPAGTWKLWAGRRKTPKVTIKWKQGLITDITDSTGKHTTLQALLTAKAAEDSARFANEATAVSKGIQPAPPAVFTYMEKMPEFKGNFNAWLTKNMRYPPAAKKARLEGRVVVKFMVNEDGSVTNAVVERSLNADCDAEALRLISAMPKWKPAEQGGKAHKTFFRVSVRFSLN